MFLFLVIAVKNDYQGGVDLEDETAAGLSNQS